MWPRHLKALRAAAAEREEEEGGQRRNFTKDGDFPTDAGLLRDLRSNLMVLWQSNPKPNICTLFPRLWQKVKYYQ
jgi:hypothetical protein